MINEGTCLQSKDLKYRNIVLSYSGDLQMKIFGFWTSAIFNSLTEVCVGLIFQYNKSSSYIKYITRRIITNFIIPKFTNHFFKYSKGPMVWNYFVFLLQCDIFQYGCNILSLVEQTFYKKFFYFHNTLPDISFT